MIVVSDTSPITNLAKVGQLELLPKLYGRVVIAQAVYDEIVLTGSGKPGAVEIQFANWIDVKTANNKVLITNLTAELDAGEAESIALSIELKAELLVIDERAGRKVAARFGLDMIGLLGVLVEAKKQGLIPFVRPVLDDLRNKAGFWVADRLYDQVLLTVSEINP